VRVSVGLEDFSDITSDIKQGRAAWAYIGGQGVSMSGSISPAHSIIPSVTFYRLSTLWLCTSQVRARWLREPVLQYTITCLSRAIRSAFEGMSPMGISSPSRLQMSYSYASRTSIS